MANPKQFGLLTNLTNLTNLIENKRLMNEFITNLLRNKVRLENVSRLISYKVVIYSFVNY